MNPPILNPTPQSALYHTFLATNLKFFSPTWLVFEKAIPLL